MLLQMRLAELGFDPSGVDGGFGPGTARAVRAFQETEGLEADGIVGDGTAAALDFDARDEIPSGFPGVSVTAVAGMFSPHTPLKNIREHLPSVLGALLEAELKDQSMVLMALSSIRAETEGFRPISELRSRFNTSEGGHLFDKYDDRSDLGNRGRPDGASFKGRGFIQLTGRDNYERHGSKIGLGARLVLEPDLANDPAIASRLLASFIKGEEEKIRDALVGDDLPRARKLVNGGRHGLEQFTDAYRKGRELIAADLELARA